MSMFLNYLYEIVKSLIHSHRTQSYLSNMSKHLINLYATVKSLTHSHRPPIAPKVKSLIYSHRTQIAPKVIYPSKLSSAQNSELCSALYLKKCLTVTSKLIVTDCSSEFKLENITSYQLNRNPTTNLTDVYAHTPTFVCLNTMSKTNRLIPKLRVSLGITGRSRRHHRKHSRAASRETATHSSCLLVDSVRMLPMMTATVGFERRVLL